ncbi:enoyl-CoA hydratase [Halobacteriales archaeon SW_7_68_16]|nr:MAG: enoyl-CoA hydratase [Halobacteriales archaeon SW_7_68_16]
MGREAGREGVAYVTLAYPELRNTLTADVAEGLVDAMRGVGGSDARCVHLAAEGPAFCAGGDVNAMVEGVEAAEKGGRDPEQAREAVVRTASAVTAVATCDVPTVAALEGPAYGAGAALALAADVVLASEEAGISFGFRPLGLAVDSGTSYFLPRVVGESTAKELVFTGEMVEADRAADLGLFNRVFSADSFEDEVASFVESVATGPTAALSASKRLIEAGGRRSLPDAVRAESDAQVEMATTEDHAEGVRAFVAERDPEFEGT